MATVFFRRLFDFDTLRLATHTHIHTRARNVVVANKSEQNGGKRKRTAVCFLPFSSV